MENFRSRNWIIHIIIHFIIFSLKGLKVNAEASLAYLIFLLTQRPNVRAEKMKYRPTLQIPGNEQHMLVIMLREFE